MIEDPVKKKHLPGPIPPGNQTDTGPMSSKSDRALQKDTDENGSLEKGGEREQGDRQGIRETYGHVPSARYDGTKRSN